MSIFSGLRRAALCGIAAAAIASPVAQAQQPMPPQAAAIAHCLCLQQAMSAFSGEMQAKSGALSAERAQLDQLNQQVEQARSTLDVNNPDAVAQFKQLLAQRDHAFEQSNGDLVAAARAAVDRYNASVREFNSACANQPQDPILLNQVRATLSCPPLY